jgi:hypothetical protein
MRDNFRPKNVKHWAAKKRALMAIWNCVTQFELTERMYPEARDADFAERVNENLDNWERHFPVRRDGPGPRFFQNLRDELKLNQGISANQLKLCSIGEFIDLFSDEKLQRKAWLGLKAAVDSGTKFSDDVTEAIDAACKQIGAQPPAPVEELALEDQPSLKAIFHEMMVRHRSHLESIRDAAKAGQLDQKHFYLAPESAEAWLALVRAEAYPTYDQCKTALRRLVESDSWRSAIDTYRPTTVVMLAGGGAPTKDLVLMQGLLKQAVLAEAKIEYFLFDISPYMLWSSYWWLYDSLPEIDPTKRVHVQLVADDVLILKEITSGHLRRTGSTIFAITGGTIGNLPEQRFFDTLNRVSEAGDLLIVSADTIPESTGKALTSTEGKIIAKYDHPDLKRFIAPAARSLAAELELSNPVASVLDAVKTDIDERQRYSDVPDSISLTMHMESPKKRVNMLSSTRYRRSSFSEFVLQNGWRLIEDFESPRNPDYFQFFFEKF